MQSSKKAPIIVGILITLIGVALLAWSAISFSSYLEKKKTYIDIKGIVVDYEAKYDYYDDYDEFYEDETYAPIVEYVVDGVVYEIVHNEYSNPPKYLIGQQVSLKYNPRNPSDAIFKYDTSFIIPFAVGVLFSVCGVILIVSVVKKGKNN